MGMCLTLYTLHDSNVRRVLAHPPLVWQVISPDDPATFEQAQRPPPGLLARLFGRGKAPAALDLGEDEVGEADLDKAWHGIHFLLTGSAWEGEAPLDFLVSGGEEVGDVDVGSGPARAFTSDRVRAIHDALSALDEAAVRARFDPAEMMEREIYPMIWDRDPEEDDTLAYCMDHFAVLKRFVADAAGRGSGLVICVS